MNDSAKRSEQDQLRFVEAVMYGIFADQQFEDACKRRGLTPRYDTSPLLSLATAATKTQTKH